MRRGPGSVPPDLAEPKVSDQATRDEGMPDPSRMDLSRLRSPAFLLQAYLTKGTNPPCLRSRGARSGMAILLGCCNPNACRESRHRPLGRGRSRRAAGAPIRSPHSMCNPSISLCVRRRALAARGFLATPPPVRRRSHRGMEGGPVTGTVPGGSEDALLPNRHPLSSAPILPGCPAGDARCGAHPGPFRTLPYSAEPYAPARGISRTG